MQQPTFQGRNFTANLDGVAVGSEVVAFHEQDLLWYRAVVDGKHSAPEHGGTYYTVTFKSVPGCKAEEDTVSPHLASRTTPARPSRSRSPACVVVCPQVGGQQVSVWPDSLRVKDSAKADVDNRKIAQQKLTVDQRIGQLDELFQQVDRAGQHDGSLTRDEVRQLLRLLGAEASEGQLDLIFRHYDTDHSGTVSHDEFEMCLPVLRSGYTSPAPFGGANYEPEITKESSTAAQERLHEGALVAAFDPTDGLWTRASIEAISSAERRDGSVVQFFSVVYCPAKRGVVYREALRVKESEHSKVSKEYHAV
jgi:hypothetical protein